MRIEKTFMIKKEKACWYHAYHQQIFIKEIYKEYVSERIKIIPGRMAEM